MIMLIVVITILYHNKHYYGIKNGVKMLITMKTTMIKKMIVKIVRMKCL